MTIVGETNWKKYRRVILFLGPGLIGLVLFTLGPILASLGLTLFQWDLISAPQFVGLDNFREVFANSDFWQAFQHTLYFVASFKKWQSCIKSPGEIALPHESRRHACS